MNEVWKPYKDNGVIPKDNYRAELVKSELTLSNYSIILHGKKHVICIDAGQSYYRIHDKKLLFCEKFFNQKEVSYWSKNSFEEVIYSVLDSDLISYLKEVGNGAWFYENSQRHFIIIATNIVIELIETEFLTIKIEER